MLAPRGWCRRRRRSPSPSPVRAGRDGEGDRPRSRSPRGRSIARRRLDAYSAVELAESNAIAAAVVLAEAEAGAHEASQAYVRAMYSVRDAHIDAGASFSTIIEQLVPMPGANNLAAVVGTTRAADEGQRSRALDENQRTRAQPQEAVYVTVQETRTSTGAPPQDAAAQDPRPLLDQLGLNDHLPEEEGPVAAAPFQGQGFRVGDAEAAEGNQVATAEGLQVTFEPVEAAAAYHERLKMAQLLELAYYKDMGRQSVAVVTAEPPEPRATESPRGDDEVERWRRLGRMRRELRIMMGRLRKGGSSRGRATMRILGLGARGSMGVDGDDGDRSRRPDPGKGAGVGEDRQPEGG